MCILRFSWPGESFLLGRKKQLEDQQASFTSVLTAFGRAYHSRFDAPKIFDDFLVNDLISEKEFEEISRNMVKGIDFFNPQED